MPTSPRHLMFNRLLHAHWLCIAFLIPAAFLVWLHEALNLSDEMGGHLVGTRPATDGELLYNYFMGFSFFAGVGGFIAHAIYLMPKGWAWLALKLTSLAMGWYLFGVYAESWL